MALKEGVTRVQYMLSRSSRNWPSTFMLHLHPCNLSYKPQQTYKLTVGSQHGHNKCSTTQDIRLLAETPGAAVAGSGEGCLTAAQLANQARLRAREAVAEYYNGWLQSDDELNPSTTRNVCLHTQVGSSSAAFFQPGHDALGLMAAQSSPRPCLCTLVIFASLLFPVLIMFFRYCLARGGLLVTGMEQAPMVTTCTWIQLLLVWLSVGYFLAIGTVPCQIATGSWQEPPEADTMDAPEQTDAEAGR